MSGAGRSEARRAASSRADDGIAQLPGLRPIAVRQPESAGEHHLGDRLTAYLDGELGHDARERVQAHLATCPQCLAEADAARGIKQLLTRTEAPGPSGALMARLLAVAALPDDDVPPASQGPGGGAPAAEEPLTEPSGPTLGGSRLTGGSFGRGASFGGNALGAGAPLPPADPRAHQGGRFGDVRLWSGRRGTGEGPAVAERRRPAAVLPFTRPAVPRGRRLVVAAAGAFSVAAVTLGGFGSLGLAAVAGDSPVDDQHGTAVNPQVPGGNTPVLPVNEPMSVDFPSHSHIGHPYDLVTSIPTGGAANPVVNGHQLP
ncbi:MULTISPECIES: zf-HC2 domain-containing protein [Kitasatospora]|uniref:zf-HC2 domain-containing protein n=1 Tax=Kitasatospora TaxID=2063 RepID=UPI000CAECD23|nr:zf-HC2 domain-containing protein [Kitasatospora sp. GP30]MDH6141751.1 anti-sigma factor (TIGR02949 family) [Kitasatospora sp. GP30]